jgi:hypothetical protein
MPKSRPTTQTLQAGTAIAKYPNWTTLNSGQPVLDVQAPPTVEVEINQDGVARVRVREGYNANINEIRYIV